MPGQACCATEWTATEWTIVGYSKQEVDARCAARRAALEAELARLVTLLRARPNVRRVLLFGSLALDQVGESSDLDMAVIADSQASFGDRYQQFYCYLRPQGPLDLFVYTQQEWDSMVQDGGLPHRIASQARVVYQAAACEAAEEL